MSSEPTGAPGDPSQATLVRRDILGVRILGGASAFPAETGVGASLSTAEAAARLGSKDSDFSAGQYDERVGTGIRDWIDADHAGASVRLAHEAGAQALHGAGVRPGDVMAAIVSTCTPPHITKSFAAQVAISLGTSGTALDLRAGGAGGLEAWIMGAQLAASSGAPVLVIATETASRYANPGDVGNALLFGDGAAALVLGPGEAHQGVAVARSRTRRGPGEPFSVPGALPPTERAVAAGDYQFQKPTPDYLSALGGAWGDVAQSLRSDITELSAPTVAALPYAVTRAQLDRFEAQLGQDVAPSREQLRHHGCLGVAGPLALVAEHLASPSPSSALAAAAVGGGISTCSLLWLT